MNSTNPFVTFTHISCIIEKEMGGLQGGLYSLFFNAVANVKVKSDLSCYKLKVTYYNEFINNYRYLAKPTIR